MEQIPENPGPGTYSTEKYTDFRSSKSAPGSMQNKGNAAGSVSINGSMERIFVRFSFKKCMNVHVFSNVGKLLKMMFTLCGWSLKLAN